MNPILNTDGEDIRGALERAAEEAGIPLELILAGAIAESGLNPRAERWGTRTREAKESMAIEDDEALQTIIDDVWPDVSFGYGQRIVAYHYVGNRTPAVENCLAVRDYVFANPGRDLLEMARTLQGCFVGAEGDLLNSLVIYNSGSLHALDDPWWQRWQNNVAGYQAALEQARRMVA